MKVRARKIVYLEIKNGKCPFEDWLNSLKDPAFARAVDARLVRIRDGNFGDHKGVGNGVYELRVPKGPGLRVYYGLKGDDLVIIIGGGDKSTQQRDIKMAKLLWSEYRYEN